VQNGDKVLQSGERERPVQVAETIFGADGKVQHVPSFAVVDDPDADGAVIADETSSLPSGVKKKARKRPRERRR